MYPELFNFNTPEFLRGILPDHITIYSYGMCIAIGAILASIYLSWQTRKEYGTPLPVSRNLITCILLATIIGGKLFFFLEDPTRYFLNPAEMLKNPGNGFVFYGSLIFGIPTIMLFSKIMKIPVLGMLDIIALTALIVHGFGRLGCFFAGCCHGLPHDGAFSIVFTNPVCQVGPDNLNTPLYPTQLYSILLILAIGLVLLIVKKNKQFDGQLFYIYIGLYAIGRSVIEIFRGDYQRGFIIKNYVSYSQLISLLLLILVGYLYRRERCARFSVPRN